MAIYVVAAESGLQKQFSSLLPPKERKKEKKSLVRKPRAVWPPAAACGRGNNNKQWKKSEGEGEGVEHSRPRCQAVLTHVHHCEFCTQTVIWLSVISEGRFHKLCGRSDTPAGTQPGSPTDEPGTKNENKKIKQQLNTLTNLIWLTT